MQLYKKLGLKNSQDIPKMTLDGVLNNDLGILQDKSNLILFSTATDQRKVLSTLLFSFGRPTIGKLFSSVFVAFSLQTQLNMST